MSAEVDTLPEFPDRVNFANGMLLDAEDLTTEQAYHRSNLAQTLLWLYGSGTVGGLELNHETNSPDSPPTEELRLNPGLAIDFLGRKIFVPEAYCIDLVAWWNRTVQDDIAAVNRSIYGPPYEGAVADLFISFASCARGKTPAFSQGPFDALDAVQDSRLRDGFRLDLVLRDRTIDPVPPTPQERWAGLGAPATLEDLKQHLLKAETWSPMLETERDQNGQPMLKERPEHVPNQDTSALLLARVAIPATTGAIATDPPTRDLERDVVVDNNLRLFVYPPTALLKVA